MPKKLIILLIILFICFFILGWAGNEIYRAYTYKRTIDGLWLRQNITYKTALDYSKNLDIYGDWVCINIRGMEIQDIIDTCQHEASHEVFAEYCQDKPLRCLEVVKNG